MLPPCKAPRLVCAYVQGRLQHLSCCRQSILLSISVMGTEQPHLPFCEFDSVCLRKLRAASGTVQMGCYRQHEKGLQSFKLST